MNRQSPTFHHHHKESFSSRTAIIFHLSVVISFSSCPRVMEQLIFKTNEPKIIYISLFTQTQTVHNI